MKNNNLFILMAAVFALISCGTANRSAQYSGAQFRNSIYYTPDSRNSMAYMQEQEQLKELQDRTSGTVQKATDSPGTKTIYVGENNEVDIQYVPGTTYTIMDDPESYEARLRKFDSPTYTVNIDFGLYDPYPWYDYRYGWYSPYGGSWYPNWSHPWYGAMYPWYSASWRWDWQYRWDRFHNWGWGWYDPFYDPWWGHVYWPAYNPGYWPVHRPAHRPDYRPGHYPGHGPGARPDKGRDVYYGKRNSSPTYRDADRNNAPAGKPVVAGKPNTGSVTRRPANVTQINNGTHRPETAAPAQTNGNSKANGNNQYRRVAPANGAKGNTNANVTKGTRPAEKKSSATATYNRNTGNRNPGNSSQYNRSGNTQSRSSYSSGNSGRSSGNSSSGSSGSSYRRR